MDLIFLVPITVGPAWTYLDTHSRTDGVFQNGVNVIDTIDLLSGRRLRDVSADFKEEF